MAKSSARPADSAELIAEVIDHGPVSAQQVTVIGLCMFFNMLDGFDITSMAVVASAVSADLELTADRLGWIFSFALAGMMAGAMLLAPLSDVLGRRKLVIVSIVLVGVSVVLTARAESLLEFIVLRFAAGMGAGAVLASQAALAAEYSPTRYRAAAVALVTSGYPLGAMMTSIAAAYVVPEFGWRGMFWFGGGLTLLMSVAAWLLIPESLKYLIERRPDGALARSNAILRKMGKAALTEMPAISRAVAAPASGRYRFGLLGREHRTSTLTLWTAFFLCFSTLYFLMSWIPALVEDSGYTAADGRDAFFLFNLGGVLGIYVMSAFSTRWRLTSVICYMSVAAGLAMAVFASAPNQLTLLMVLIFVIGILQQGGFTGLYSTAAQVYPTEMRTTGIGWAIGLGRLGAVFGPALAGYLIAAGFDMSHSFYFFAVPMAVGGLIAFRLRVD